MNLFQGSLRHEWPIKRLGRISPSKYAALLECPLKVCWDANRDAPPPIPSGPLAQLGSVIHLLLESASKGKLPNAQLREGCESDWQALLEKHEATLRQSPKTSWMVPLETTAFRFAEKVEQALGRAVQLATFRAPNMPISDSSVQARSAEQWLETQDKQVGGQVDLISITPDGVTLKDYKSGTIHEGDEGTIKEAYSMQLKLYAAIYHDAYGEWPKTLELAPLFGQPQQVPFTEKECLELLEQAKAELARVNSLVERKAIQDAANPSPKCCRYCGFRPVCSKYLKAIQIPSANSWPSDVVGRIDSIVAAGTRRVISVNMAGKPVKIWMPESDGTVSGSLKVGDALNAFNLAKRSSGDLEIWKGTFVSD